MALQHHPEQRTALGEQNQTMASEVVGSPLSQVSLPEGPSSPPPTKPLESQISPDIAKLIKQSHVEADEMPPWLQECCHAPGDSYLRYILAGARRAYLTLPLVEMLYRLLYVTHPLIDKAPIELPSPVVMHQTVLGISQSIEANPQYQLGIPRIYSSAVAHHLYDIALIDLSAEDEALDAFEACSPAFALRVQPLIAALAKDAAVKLQTGRAQVVDFSALEISNGQKAEDWTS